MQRQQKAASSVVGLFTSEYAIVSRWIVAAGIFVRTGTMAQAQVTTAQTKPITRASEINGFVSQVESRIEGAQREFWSIAAGIREFPTESGRIYETIQSAVITGGHRILPLLVLFIFIGVGAQWLIRAIWTRSFAGSHAGHSTTGVSDRLYPMASNLTLSLLEFLALAVASIGTFVAFLWPDIVRSIVLGYLLAFLGFSAVRLLARTMLQPRDPPLRVMPVDDLRASFWYRRILWMAGVACFGIVTIELMGRLGASLAVQDFLRAFFSALFVVIAIISLWQSPADSVVKNQRRRLFLSMYFVVLWLLWLFGFRVLFLFGLVLVAVPAVMSVVDRSIAHLLRPIAADSADIARYAAATVIAQRAMRAIVVIGAALFLHGVIKAEFPENENGMLLRAAGMLLNAIIAFSLFDFLWRLTRAYIDKKIADFRQEGVPVDEQTVRRHRIGTVLPILRNFLFVLIATIVILMYLASIGVAIAPLIAGAGVFGIAIGFGSQALVRDVLSGIFYLMDDAFRVGEYIQSGSYMGTVEGFTLRSIRLRHHRGPVFTVPFGSLGAIQNMSRDWALDKIVLSVPYNADIVLAKKLIKQVGRELMENPEFAPHILQTIKMQGIAELGDSAVKIKLKLMTRPGQQGPIRMWALSRIKALFEEYGIEFASPTVRVADGQSNKAAAAVQSLVNKPKPSSV